MLYEIFNECLKEMVIFDIVRGKQIETLKLQLRFIGCNFKK